MTFRERRKHPYWTDARDEQREARERELERIVSEVIPCETGRRILPSFEGAYE